MEGSAGFHHCLAGLHEVGDTTGRRRRGRAHAGEGVAACGARQSRRWHARSAATGRHEVPSSARLIMVKYGHVY